MALFKCKMCGGSLDVDVGTTVIECEYCGTHQTLPKLDDDKRANMYDRANHFRRNNEFDKAMGIYENILNEDNTDAEAYWSLVLCRYGIEYVEDPASHRRIPTVNRAQFTSIFDDDNYKSALQYADGYQRHIYEEEAKTINEMQKGILAISQKEEPFDVFICYKESDNGGRRTPDSVLAQDLYYQLTQEGFKVFFARITLEDKLGSAYEPYIFAALNSAKVMVVLGTKPEFFNAAWVKNEWSRYLALIKQGQKKLLIPAYKDMDPYDLPEEFSHLQAQDMSKLGFMQDLIRGIKKILQADAPKATAKETVVVNGAVNIAPLLRRAFMFLEDGNWDEAAEYCEKVLDQDPENAQAYLGKLMAELHVRRKEQLADCRRAFDANDNYRKTVRFADEKLKTEMLGFIEHINTRNENERLAAQYESIVQAMNMATTEDDYKAVAERFAEMGTYSEAARLSKECLEKAEAARVEALERAETARKNSIYTNACQLKAKNTIRDLEQAIARFREIPGWKDSQEQIYACEKRIAEIKADQERCRLEKERQDELARIAKEQRIQKTKKFFKIATPITAGVVVCILLMVLWIIPTVKFNNAVSLMEEGKYGEARSILVELDGFSSSENKLAILDAIGTIENGEFDSAIKEVLSASEAINVKYNLNGGTSSSGDTFTYETSSDYSSLLAPQKEGYRFVEWKLSGYSYSKDNSLELVLDAVWSDGYFITYKLDGGTATNPAEYHKDGEAVTLSNPTKKGYTFIGWTGTDLTDLTMNVTIPAGSYGDREYTANWKPNEYTFTLNANGGTVSSSSVSANYDASYTLPTPTRDYYTFAGWYDGTKKYENGTWDKASNVTLTAKWTPVSYTITYNLSGGTNSSQNAKNFTVESSKISLKDPTRTGYKFLGWYKESSYSTKVTEIATGSHENISLYAKWEIINYTITYELNGGTISGTKKTSFTVNDLPLTLPSATKSGLVFLNWSKETFDGESISKITEVGNITVVASYMDPNLKLTLSKDGTYYTVSDYAGAATEIIIPSYYNGKPIKEIGGSAFSGCSSLVTIQIPSTVNKIGYSAFNGCRALKNINIPNGITSIGSYTFKECRALVSLTLPNSVTSIGEDAFYRCENLVSINMPATLTSLGDNAFCFCGSLKTITIPSGVKSLGFGVFYGCYSLTSVTIPDTVTQIDGYVFDGCRSLTKIIIPSSVTKMGGAFPGCSNLTIYCRATMIPDGWSSGWNSSRPVVWGYTGN